MRAVYTRTDPVALSACFYCKSGMSCGDDMGFTGYDRTWDERQAATAALAVASRVLPSLKLSSAACTAASTCSVARRAACANYRLQITGSKQATHPVTRRQAPNRRQFPSSRHRPLNR